ETFYIGDETRDIQAAKKNHIYSIAVTWGFNNKKVLAAEKPDFLIDNPKELLAVLKTL
ncbi:MAG TPA: HAD hydrolase-like protein, partial [Gammaproteobacteria bacterium]|nr:HAD hydrolase-like protein [Gammaproteobacteria bacterium]